MSQKMMLETFFRVAAHPWCDTPIPPRAKGALSDWFQVSVEAICVQGSSLLSSGSSVWEDLSFATWSASSWKQPSEQVYDHYISFQHWFVCYIFIHVVPLSCAGLGFLPPESMESDLLSFKTHLGMQHRGVYFKEKKKRPFTTQAVQMETRGGKKPCS